MCSKTTKSRLESSKLLSGMYKKSLVRSSNQIFRLKNYSIGDRIALSDVCFKRMMIIT